MAENNSPSTEVHIYKPDEHGKNNWKWVFYLIRVDCIGNTVVIEGEKHWTNDGDPNSSMVTESHHQKEQIIIENPNDPLSSVTHRLEDIHVTVNNENTVSVASIDDKTHEVKGNYWRVCDDNIDDIFIIIVKANDAIDTAQDNLNATDEKATELKHDAAVVGHDVKETAKETAHNVQGTIWS
jgi:hypothetical protein